MANIFWDDYIPSPEEQERWDSFNAALAWLFKDIPPAMVAGVINNYISGQQNFVGGVYEEKYIRDIALVKMFGSRDVELDADMDAVIENIVYKVRMSDWWRSNNANHESIESIDAEVEVMVSEIEERMDNNVF